MSLGKSSSRPAVFSAVAEVLHEMFEIDLADITPQSNLVDDLDIDSIDAVDLSVRLTTMTGSRLPPEVFKTVRTVDDVVGAILTLLAEK